MRARSFEPNDLSATASILADCNKTDTLGRFIYKDIDKYPASYRQGNLRFVRIRVHSIGAVTQVVETEPSDYPPAERWRAPEIVGFATWCRHGSSPTADKWKASSLTPSAKFDRALREIEERYHKIFPSVQPTWSAGNFTKALPFLSETWDPVIFAEAWELQLLFVRPDWHRRGVGKRLMKWGFETAQEEKVPVLVKSSPMGGAAYRAAGFRALKELGLAELYDPLQFGGEISKAWVWEPILQEGDGLEGNWYERAKALIEGKGVTNVVG